MAYSAVDTSDVGGTLCTLGLSAAALSSAAASCTPAEFSATSLAYTTGGALLAGGSDGRVRLWRSALPQAAGADMGDLSSWALSPDGRTMAAWISSPPDKPLLTGIWSIAAPGGPVLDAALPVSAQETEYVSPTVLLTVTSDGAVRLWDLRDPRHPVRGASLGTAAVSPETGVSVQAEGSLVAVQDAGGRLQLWHVTGADAVSEAGSVPASGTAPGFAGITANARAAVMFTKAGITWWDIADPARPVRVGVTPPKPMEPGVGLGAGGVFAAESGGSGPQDEGTDLYLFDVSGGRPGTGVSLAASTGGLLSISADARLLAATGPGNNAVTLWNIADQRQPSLLATLPTLPGAAGLAFDPNGNQLAVWNNDSVQLWDITDPDVPVLQAIVVPPGGGQGSITEAAYVPVGPPRLIVGTYSSIYVYDADPAHLANSICPYTGDFITARLWNAYAPRTPYVRPCR